jgi:hypothetical protein
VTSVRDLVVHDDDLAIATHGRGFWILDNISPLRELSGKTAGEEAVLFRPAKAVRLNPERFQGTPFPVEEPKGKNPPAGAPIDYYLKGTPGDEATLNVTLEILQGTKLVRKYSSKDAPAAGGGRGARVVADVWVEKPQLLTAHAGTNRFAWDMRYGAPGGAGPHAVPGEYTVRLTAGGKSYTQPLRVAMDPRSVATAAELSRQLEFGLGVVRAMERAAAVSPAPAAVMAELEQALAIAESADRMPPATAYALFERARKALQDLQATRTFSGIP